jgi:Uma2 family endonuclease
MATVAKRATMEDFLRAEAEAPEGTRLALIDGEIVEWGANMTTRNARHSVVMAKIGFFLIQWLESHPEIVGVIAGGEARCRLRTNPDITVGLDMAFFEGEKHLNAASSADFFDGPPRVAIEVLSGSDTHEDVVDRLRVFFECGVPQVWVVDPDLRNVTIHRPSGDAAIYSAKQALTAGPELPGFQVPVDSLFPRVVQQTPKKK